MAQITQESASLPLAVEEQSTTIESDEASIPNPSSSYAGGVDVTIADDYEWSSCLNDAQLTDEVTVKIPYVGDKEPLSSLAAEFQSGSPILQEKIKLIGEQYAALRRIRRDGNCFFRSFMFSYLEHILETQDKAEVERITVNIDQCKKTLQDLGYVDFTFEDFFSGGVWYTDWRIPGNVALPRLIFIEQLESVLQGKETSITNEELLERSRDQYISDYVVMFFRFVVAAEIRKRSDFFEPFILGLTNSTVDQFIKTSVEPMGEESDHVHITALSDALGVAIRVVYLDRSSCENGTLTVNHHDFIPSVCNTDGLPKPFVTLLYRPGHYEMLYSK